MHYFYTPDIRTSNELPLEEAAHAIRVLRLQIGDEIMLINGKGSFFKAKISDIGNKRCFFSIMQELPQAPIWNGHLHIAIAPTKNMDRIEWFTEKATEIGIDEITFLLCRYSERKVVKNERIEKILISGIKQSLKSRLPRLNDMTDFKKFVAQDIPGGKYIAHCYKDTERVLLKDVLTQGLDATILIGPEGDFSEEEVDLAIRHGFTPVSLGTSRLRTETAALAACHTFVLKNEI
ncbi:MAG: 16S rRNA (uracil(1498)-N(3))-methyltransferase [Bacteroidales bacterium]|nr:16S rRNA (uracil(1498)-N(3))-methyltransferase [Bacteroidales bacterium]